jgi:hypothetical protein
VVSYELEAAGVPIVLDLGRALRLDGESGAAVQIFSERLRIENQRPVVQHELDLARGAGA